jgi:ankyrin repeat protein
MHKDPPGDLQSAFKNAVVWNDPQEVRAILNRGADVNRPWPGGELALNYCIRNLSPIRDILLSHKDIDVNKHEFRTRSTFQDCLTPLAVAIKNNLLDSFDLLLEKKADVNTTISVGSFGETPLHMAVIMSRIVMVERLLQNGAILSLAQGDSDGRLPSENAHGEMRGIINRYTDDYRRRVETLVLPFIGVNVLLSLISGYVV